VVSGGGDDDDDDDDDDDGVVVVVMMMMMVILRRGDKWRLDVALGLAGVRGVVRREQGLPEAGAGEGW
jgi:hypothetical protein